MRFSIRVTPGAKRPSVGGRHGDALVVKVSARAVEGAANAAVVAALAESFGIRKSAVTIVRGHTARTKLVDVDIDPAKGSTRLTELLG